MKKHRYRFLWLYLLLPAAFLLRRLCAQNAQATETVYSRHIYPLLTSAVSPAFRYLPFSAAELLAVLAAVAIVWGLIRRVAWLFRGKAGFFRFLLKLGAAACTLFFLFEAMWGLNYYRQPLVKTLGYRQGAPSAAELTALLTRETDAVNALCPEIEYKNGSSVCPGGFRAISGQASAGFDWYMSGEKPDSRFLSLVPSRAKGFFPSGALSYIGIEGIYIPFTCEPTVDAGWPDFILPFTVSHETAHFKGFAREDEANYLAYLACVNNPDVYFNYSGHMNAYLYLAQALASADPAAWKKLAPSLDRRAAGDIDGYSRYLTAHESRFQKTAEQINDRYLKSQGQAGIVTYDGFVNLLADAYRSGKDG